MAKIKPVFYSFYRRICNYNLFIPDENDYDDEEEEEERNPAITLEHQKDATRLYQWRI